MEKVMDALMAMMEDEVKKISPFCKFLTGPGFFIINLGFHLLKLNIHSNFIGLI